MAYQSKLDLLTKKCFRSDLLVSVNVLKDEGTVRIDLTDLHSKEVIDSVIGESTSIVAAEVLKKHFPNGTRAKRIILSEQDKQDIKVVASSCSSLVELWGKLGFKIMQQNRAGRYVGFGAVTPSDKAKIYSIIGDDEIVRLSMVGRANAKRARNNIGAVGTVLSRRSWRQYLPQ